MLVRLTSVGIQDEWLIEKFSTMISGLIHFWKIPLVAYSFSFGEIMMIIDLVRMANSKIWMHIMWSLVSIEVQ